MRLDTIAQKVQNFIARGNQSLELNRPFLAAEMFKQALELVPTSIEARKRLRMAQILMFKKSAPSQLKLKAKKFSSFFKQLNVSSLIKKGKGIEAMNVCEELLAVNPFDQDYIDLAVKAAEVANLPEAAAITIEAAFAGSDAKDKKLLEKVATYYTIAKNYEKAKEVYKTLLVLNPTDQRLLQLMKNVEAQLTIASGWEQNAGKVGGTRDLLANPEQASQLDRQNASNLVGDDVDKAAKEYIGRIAANKEDLNAYRALARIYLKAKRFNEAVDILNKAVEVSKSDPELDKMLSNAKLSAFDMIIDERKKRNEDYAAVQAERDQFLFDDLQNRVARYPNDLHLRYELGSLYCKFEYYDEAIEHLQLSQKSPKDRLESLYLLAICFIKKGQTDLGVMQLETAASQIQTMDELKKKVVYQLGRCAEDSGDIEKAYSYYRDIYSTDIGFEDLNDRMMDLSKKLKEKKA